MEKIPFKGFDKGAVSWLDEKRLQLRMWNNYRDFWHYRGIAQHNVGGKEIVDLKSKYEIQHLYSLSASA